MGAKELSAVLSKEIRAIPALLRTVLVLRDVQRLPMRNIDVNLGITVPAAKSGLMRARHELRERLAKHWWNNGLRHSGPQNRPTPYGVCALLS